MSAEDIRDVVKELGAMKAVLDRAVRGDLADLYGALRLEVSYNYKTRVTDVSIEPTRVWLALVSEEEHAP